MSTDAGRSDQVGNAGKGNMTIDLEARPEQRHIRFGGCFRYVDFHLLVSRLPESADNPAPARTPLALALVLDRSGSMQGEKLRTAKRAALGVVDRLDARDSVAVVIFDDKIETLQSAAPATDELKTTVRAKLAAIEARAMTALHEGWLSGCEALTSTETAGGERVARCFLLTDGLANVGLTDPEQIAAQAAGIRGKAGIGTSTFGIGEDYSEELLGPMAQAGGGAFYHLRHAQEIATTFVAELGELLAVAAPGARLEIEAEPGMTVDVVSGFWAEPGEQAAGEPTRWTVSLGDLVAGDEHHVVARVRFPERTGREEQGLRARVVWMRNGAEAASGWRELRFPYAEDAVCDAEPRDAEVARFAGQHLSDRTMREAIRLSKTGDLAGAQHLLEQNAGYVAHLSMSAPELGEEVQQMRATGAAMARGPLPSATSKEAYFARLNRSTGRPDRRSGSTQPNEPAEAPKATGDSGNVSDGDSGQSQP